MTTCKERVQNNGTRELTVTVTGKNRLSQDFFGVVSKGSVS